STIYPSDETVSAYGSFASPAVPVRKHAARGRNAFKKRKMESLGIDRTRIRKGQHAGARITIRTEVPPTAPAFSGFRLPALAQYWEFRYRPRGSKLYHRAPSAQSRARDQFRHAGRRWRGFLHARRTEDRESLAPRVHRRAKFADDRAPPEQSLYA